MFFFSVHCCREKIFPRKLEDLRAARLNGEVVVTGGGDNEGNVRDEVLFEMILLIIFLLQVYQYNPAEDEWTQIGKMKRGRWAHAIVEANLRAVCLGISIISYI